MSDARAEARTASVGHGAGIEELPLDAGHRHSWQFDDRGGHWCADRHDGGCTATVAHDFPCDRPDEHAGEAEPPPGRTALSEAGP